MEFLIYWILAGFIGHLIFIWCLAKRDGITFREVYLEDPHWPKIIMILFWPSILLAFDMFFLEEKKEKK